MSFYDPIYRHAVFPWLQFRSKRNLLAELRKLQRQLSDSAAVAKLQARSLQAIVRHAAETCPFWQQRFREADINAQEVTSIHQLADLPILEKSEVRENLEGVSSTQFLDSRSEAFTGGSTASPLKFYRDQCCIDSREAVRAYYWQSIGKSLYDRWINIWGSMRDIGDSASKKSLSRQELKRRVMMIPANQLHEDSIAPFVTQIRHFSPVLLHGYSQAIYLFARMIRRSGLEAQLPSSLQAVTTTAEPLYGEQKQFIAEVMKVPVFRVYGTREFGFIGGELPGKLGLQVNPMNVIVECVDSAGKAVAPGESGQLLITDLLNRATPLLRYRIGDIGSLAETNLESDCWQVLDINAGRETDFVLTNDNRLVCGASLTLVNSPGISQLQYIQSERGAITVRYVANQADPAKDLQIIANSLAGIVGDLRIDFEQVDEIKPTSSGKFQYVNSTVARDWLGAI